MENGKSIFEKVKDIVDPYEMLECILDNEDYYGHDPYYAPIKIAIFNRATEIVEKHKKRTK